MNRKDLFIFQKDISILSAIYCTERVVDQHTFFADPDPAVFLNAYWDLNPAT